jgi:hypothetical protein
MKALTQLVVPMCLAATSMATPAVAQDEAALKSYFEGKRVVVRIDMPGSAGGVDVRGDGDSAMNMQRYRNDLRQYGTAIHAGDGVTVTLVKVKKDNIEFQLGGGGFGTFGDDASTSVNYPDVEKSNREKDLEKRVKAETDRDRKRALQRELDDMRNYRERENRRIAIERQRLEEQKRARIAEQRLRGGSRFNIRYEDRVPIGVKPEDIVATLAEFVDFRAGDGSDPPMPSGDITQLRKGLQRSEAERLFGRPVQSSDRREGSIVITTLTFVVGEQRIAAEFVEDVLVRYTISSR